MGDYDFRALSPIDFEVFVRDLLNADKGLKLVTFAVGPDGGIDLRDSESVDLPVIVQCKHMPSATKRTLVASAKGEAMKLAGVKMHSYIFIVSAPLTPDAEDEIREELVTLKTSNVEVWHKGKINEALQRFKQVEQTHFKLWLSSSTALVRIVNSAEWLRSEELVQRIIDRAKLFVATPSYSLAREILANQNVLIITGPPGVGKSTLAEMLLLDHWEQGWRIANIDSDVKEGWKQIREGEQPTILFYDDFLGQASSAELNKNEAGSLTALLEKIHRGKGKYRIILTSREQVFGEVIHGLDDRLRRLGTIEGKLTIDLAQISRLNKAEILFNHLYFGFENDSIRRMLASDVRYLQVVDHIAFNPRILETVAIVNTHIDVDSFYVRLFESLENPEEIWSVSFRQLPSLAVDILLRLASEPERLTLDELRFHININEEREWMPTLRILDGTWITLNPRTGPVTSVALFDPSRRDYLLSQFEEEHFLKRLLENLVKCSQLAYLLRLAGYLQNTVSGEHFKNRPVLGGNLAGELHSLDYLIVKVAGRNLELASESERKRSSAKLLREAGIGTRTVSWQGEKLSERLDTLLSLAALAFGTPMAQPLAENLLCENVKEFLEMCHSRVYPDSTSLFRLGAWLAEDIRPSWAHDSAAEILMLAFEHAEQSSDLLEYGEVSQAYREGEFIVVGEKLLVEAIEREVDAIRQQSPDFELMESILSELEHVIDELGVDYSLDSILNEIDELKSTYRESSGYSGQSYRRTTTVADASDADLSSLFSKLI
ncbi:restriction endonuclease [Arthrobacter sp. lap29]|uniref:nSTAND3 domain-containing NTPase n=1 Tax=Arthrobacter sp. lap29 TaxID=3056122 RepID=UPI0028F6DECC|nr:restriction endonuclease [Arthrobacter sp. lap29]